LVQPLNTSQLLFLPMPRTLQMHRSGEQLMLMLLLLLLVAQLVLQQSQRWSSGHPM
jgi:hypothetical protein